MITEAWHRRQAIQIAAALPETIEDAIVVLTLARELVDTFLSGRSHPEAALGGLERERGVVVSLSSAINGNSR